MSSRKAVEQSLESIAEWNPIINSMITPLGEKALAEASRADATGQGGPLSSVAMSLKDCIDVEGVNTTIGSRAFLHNVAHEDAVLVKRLRDAGAPIIGKDNLSEWCFSGTTQNETFGSCRNPWNRDCIPGGSSGGTAASVSAGMSVAGIGTDTGGSGRVPAALCGVVGLRPTIGAIPTQGSYKITIECDCISPIARDVPTTEAVFNAIATRPSGERTDAAPARAAGLRIGIPRNFYFEDVDQDVGAAVRTFLQTMEGAGASLVDVDVWGAEDSQHETGFTLNVVEAYEQHRENLEERPEMFEPETRRRKLLGKDIPGWRYARARRWLIEWREQFDRLFDDVDIVVTPTTPIVAPNVVSTRDMIESTRRLTRNTWGIGWAGGPAMSLPCGFSDGLPIGVQIVARRWHEATLFGVGKDYQSRTEWHLQRPVI